MKTAVTLAPLAVLAAAGSALAHPGHDAPAATHWVADGSHLAVVVLLAGLGAVAVAGLVARVRAARIRRKTE